MASPCAVAKAKLAQGVHQGVGQVNPPSAWTQAGAAVKTSYLTTLTGAERHIGALALYQGYKALIGHPASVLADYLASLGKASERTSASAWTPKGIQLGINAFTKGVKEFVSAMKPIVNQETGQRMWVDPEVVGNAFSLANTHFSNPIAEQWRQLINTFVSARNKPFYEMALQLHLYQEARTMAIREGATGAALSQRTDYWLAHPTDEMVTNSLANTNNIMLSKRGPVSEGMRSLQGRLQHIGEHGLTSPLEERARAQGIQEGLTGDALGERVHQILSAKGTGSWLGVSNLEQALRFPEEKTGVAAAQDRAARMGAHALNLGITATAPFVRIGENIANATIDNSPLGLLKQAALSTVQPKGAKLRYLIQGLTVAGVGTAAGAAVGMHLAAQGKMTAGHPPPGDPPYSVKVGDTWHSLKSFAPVTLMPVLGAALHEQQQSHPDASLRNAGEAVLEQGKLITEHSILGAMQQVANLSSGTGSLVSRFLSGIVPVPPIIAQAAKATDATVRDTKDPNAAVQFGKEIGAKIPGVSHLLPPKVDAFGQDVTRAANPATRALQAFADPTNPIAADDTPVMSELRRLKVNIGKPGANVSFGGDTYQRSPEDIRAALRQSGPTIQQALTEGMADPEYQTLTDAERKRWIRSVIIDARKEANAAFLERVAR